MGNLNPKQNPITTIFGVLFILAGLLMYTLPLFIEVKKDFTESWYTPLIPVGLGFLSLLSPDSLVTGIKRIIEVKTKTITKTETTETTKTEKDDGSV
jgi:hypothetical protein